MTKPVDCHIHHNDELCLQRTNYQCLTIIMLFACTNIIMIRLFDLIITWKTLSISTHVMVIYWKIEGGSQLFLKQMNNFQMCKCFSKEKEIFCIRLWLIERGVSECNALQILLSIKSLEYRFPLKSPQIGNGKLITNDRFGSQVALNMINYMYHPSVQYQKRIEFCFN